MAFDIETTLARIPERSLKADAIKATGLQNADDFISMGVADMSFKPPSVVLDALTNEIQQGFFGYYGGKNNYKAALKNWMKKMHSWEPKSEWIHTAHGLVAAIGTALRAYTSKGDGIILFSPVYHSFKKIIQANDRNPIECPMNLYKGKYYLDLGRLEGMLTGQERMIIFCSPHNPGGRIWSVEVQRELAYFCKRHNLLLIVDEIHNDLVFSQNKHVTFPLAAEGLFDNFILMTSTTKTFNIAGGLMGNVIIPNIKLGIQFSKANMATGESPNRFGMIMGERAMEEGQHWLKSLMEYIDENRNIFDYKINSLPLVKSIRLEATYLAWVDFSKLGEDESSIMKKLVSDAKIIANPGSSFGLGGDKFVRFNLATSKELVKEAGERIRSIFEN
ncbi:MAG: aminotransferase class I/II-fold pyridoxal phosphate-dependent enzyme [Paracoccaceae bacterium]|nr:aminotransferase class I/II-fold pyridoxal phosphate-dependent enzyme [Paracoccaceae bacterium]